MKNKSFNEEQIFSALKEHEAGEKVDDICRRYGIFQGTFYSWKSKFGNMKPYDAKHLMELEAENNRLKELLHKVTLEKNALEHVLSKQHPVTQPARKEGRG